MPAGVDWFTILRRFVVIAVLMFWQGGFTFYAAVVVPVGQEVLGSHMEQGFITRQVTGWLNIAGALALVTLPWDMAPSRNSSSRWNSARWAAWAGMLVLLAILIWLRQFLDDLLDLDARELREPQLFRIGHRWYLWLSTIQWVFSVAFAILTLQAWRSEDQAAGKEAGAESEKEMLRA